MVTTSLRRSASMASTSIFSPVHMIYVLSPPAMPTSTISLMAWGSSSSSTASATEQATPSSIHWR